MQPYLRGPEHFHLLEERPRDALLGVRLGAPEQSLEVSQSPGNIAMGYRSRRVRVDLSIEAVAHGTEHGW